MAINEKRRVVAHVTFLKLGEINTLKEQFDADVLVRVTWREPALDNYKGDVADVDWDKYWSPKIYVDNACGEPKLVIAKFLQFNDAGHATVMERRRIKGTFMETLELWEFPFDVQDLSITLMSDLPATEVELVEDPEEIHKIYKQSFIDEQEWYLYKYIEGEIRELAKDRADPTVKRSALTVQCRAGRRPAYYIWNIFSVTFLIACLSFVTFAVDPVLVQNRLQLSYTLVLTAVAFKFVVNQSLPRISYLTYLDRYILATMAALTVICIWHGVQARFTKEHQERDYIALVVFLGGYIIYNIQFFCRIYAFPYRRRREMDRKEREYIKLVKREALARGDNKDKIPNMDSDSDTPETEPLTSVKSK
jgi:hypothetical protein